MKEAVNHPEHYNKHPKGIECIEVIRHYQCGASNAIKYLWREGLKQEQGKSQKAKRIEDLKKALWYMHDYQEYFYIGSYKECSTEEFYHLFEEAIHYNFLDVVMGFDAKVLPIIMKMLYTGFIFNGELTCVENLKLIISSAISDLKTYIEELEKE